MKEIETSKIWILLNLTWINYIYGENPHQPYEWILARWEDTVVIQKVITAGSPSFTVFVSTYNPMFRFEGILFLSQL